MLEKIKQLCKEHGVTMEELAKAVKVDRSTFYKWNDVSPSFNKVVEIADYFGVPITYFTE